jgi:hypothetical protein
MTVFIAGKVKLRSHRVMRREYTPKVLLTATAQAIPCSRWMVGKTSAEYWKATGPSPRE